MAFLKGQRDEITVVIKVELDGDLGKKIRVPFKATYKKLSYSEAQEVAEKCRIGSMTDEDVITNYLVGWSDLKGADEQDVEYSADAVAEAMQMREYRSALVDGFLQVTYGAAAVNAKN